MEALFRIILLCTYPTLPMTRSDIIAQVLVNSNIYKSIDEAKEAIKKDFFREFPGRAYSDWDKPVPNSAGETMIRGIGIKNGNNISLRNFIADLEAIS